MRSSIVVIGSALTVAGAFSYNELAPDAPLQGTRDPFIDDPNLVRETFPEQFE